MPEEPIKKEEKWRNEDGTFREGHPGGPGRPKGKTLKEYAREWFANKSEEEKAEYLEKIEEKKPGFAWSMAEGNPHQDTTFKGEVEVSKIISIDE